MTILVLMKHAGLKIPPLKELAEKFPEIRKMKGSRFGVFDKMVAQWAQKEIDLVNGGDKSIDTIINKFKSIYSIDPVQKSVTGEVKQNGQIEKFTKCLKAPMLSQNGESFTLEDGKKKFIAQIDKYIVIPTKNGIA